MKVFFDIITVIALVFLVCWVVVSFVSCTYSVTIVQTSGKALDVVDETATNTPSTSVSVPIKP